MKVSVIIPTLNAEKELPALLDMLIRQTHRADEIIVVDSASDDHTVRICQTYRMVHLIQINRKDFDHGKTRDMALRMSEGDIVVFLTQDALPANESFLGNLIAPFSREENIALSTGRQLPRADATLMERFVREYNYPDHSSVRSKDDLPQMGIKAFFCSDVCCAYRRSVYLALGGFDYPLKTNEDMFFAAKVIHAGYRISYTADAMVYHSHHMTLKEQYHRNYIQGYEIEKRNMLLDVGSYQQEGIILVRYVSGKLLKNGHLIAFIHFLLDCCARKLGNTMGRKTCRREMNDREQRKRSE